MPRLILRSPRSNVNTCYYAGPGKIIIFRNLFLTMPVYVDQLNRQVNIKSSPQRIVSLVPSQTELLFDLRAAGRVVGVTKFCIHPAEAIATTTIVGGTKQIKHDVIKALQPDLIIANKEENTKEDLELLMQHYPVWISDIKNLNDVFSMIANDGEIIGREN